MPSDAFKMCIVLISTEFLYIVCYFHFAKPDPSLVQLKYCSQPKKIECKIDSLIHRISRCRVWSFLQIARVNYFDSKVSIANTNTLSYSKVWTSWVQI